MKEICKVSSRESMFVMNLKKACHSRLPPVKYFCKLLPEFERLAACVLHVCVLFASA